MDTSERKHIGNGIKWNERSQPTFMNIQMDDVKVDFPAMGQEFRYKRSAESKFLGDYCKIQSTCGESGSRSLSGIYGWGYYNNISTPFP